MAIKIIFFKLVAISIMGLLTISNAEAKQKLGERADQCMDIKANSLSYMSTGTLGITNTCDFDISVSSCVKENGKCTMKGLGSLSVRAGDTQPLASPEPGQTIDVETFACKAPSSAVRGMKNNPKNYHCSNVSADVQKNNIQSNVPYNESTYKTETQDQKYERMEKHAREEATRYVERLKSEVVAQKSSVDQDACIKEIYKYDDVARANIARAMADRGDDDFANRIMINRAHRNNLFNYKSLISEGICNNSPMLDQRIDGAKNDIEADKNEEENNSVSNGLMSILKVVGAMGAGMARV